MGKRIVNIDETIINVTDSRNYSWSRYGRGSIRSETQRISRVSIIAACFSTGSCCFTVNYGYTTSMTFTLFLIRLSDYLNATDPGWRRNTVLLIDNAPYHRRKEMQQRWKEMKLPIMFLGPYSYSMAPVEKVFRQIKARDLNPL